MAEIIWWFWIYSFLGYGVEKLFAAVTRSPHQVRKCFLLLPLCPVYGLGMLAVLALPESVQQSGWLIVWGGAAATAVEYVVHWLYDRFLRVAFWDYGAMFGNLHGRVCIPFTAAWGLMSAAAVWYIHPAVVRLVGQIPPEITYPFLLIFTADAVCTVFFLRETADIDGLQMSRLLHGKNIPG